MKSILRLLTLIFLFFTTSQSSFAWGRKGHEIVAEIAFHYLDDSTKAKVLHYLGKLTIEEAAVWMDDMRSNSYYDFMKPWHYLNIEKGEIYKPNTKDRDVLIILNSSINGLKHKENLKFDNIKEDLYYLFHLMGDLHQPLHVGYGSDRGGNDIPVSYLHKNNSSNLHKVWDDEIIETKNISLDDCLKQKDFFTNEQILEIQKIELMKWMNQSRALLDTVYNFKDGFIDQEYVDRNAVVIERQIFIAGLRLAAVLKETFKN